MYSPPRTGNGSKKKAVACRKSEKDKGTRAISWTGGNKSAGRREDYNECVNSINVHILNGIKQCIKVSDKANEAQTHFIKRHIKIRHKY
jgi:hypothetical protein